MFVSGLCLLNGVSLTLAAAAVLLAVCWFSENVGVALVVAVVVSSALDNSTVRIGAVAVMHFFGCLFFKSAIIIERKMLCEVCRNCFWV